jgi:hypothetical protein
MRKRNKTLPVLSACVALVALAQEVPQAEKLASVEGKVTSSLTGEPLLRAHIFLENNVNGGQQSYGALTRADGSYSIKGISPGSYAISAQRIGFVSSNASVSNNRLVTLEAGAKRTDFNLKLTPTGSISGRVLNPAGEPIEGAQVSAIAYSQIVKSTSTDARGNFRIASLEPGKYRVVAKTQSVGIPPETRTDGTTEVNLRSTFYPNSPDEKSATRVTVPPGSDVAGVEIQLLRVPFVKVSGIVHDVPKGSQNMMVVGVDDLRISMITGRVQADGSFEIWRADPGTYELKAEVFGAAGGILSAPVRLEVGSVNVENIELNLVPSATISGHVEYDDEQAKPPAKSGRPAVAGRISVEPVSQYRIFGNSSLFSDIAADGTFTLPGVQPVLYRVRVSWSPTYVKSMRLGDSEIEGGILDLRHGPGNGSLTLRVSSATAEVSGTVKDEKGPVAGAHVFLGQEDQDMGPMMATSDAKGAYSLHAIAPDKYRVLAINPNDGTVLRAGLREEYAAAAELLDLAANDKVVRDLRLFAPEK